METIARIRKYWTAEKSIHLLFWRLVRHFRHRYIFRQEWQFTHYDRAGNIIWQSDWAPNDMADEGENAILDVFYRAAAAPAGFFIRLYNDTPVETDTLTLLTGEPVGNGYAPIAVERSAVGFPTIALDAGDWQVTSKTVQFVASGGTIGPVTYAVLSTTSDNTGLLIGFKALSQSRTLADGEKLDVTLKIKQQ